MSQVNPENIICKIGRKYQLGSAELICDCLEQPYIQASTFIQDEEIEINNNQGRLEVGDIFGFRDNQTNKIYLAIYYDKSQKQFLVVDDNSHNVIAKTFQDYHPGYKVFRYLYQSPDRYISQIYHSLISYQALLLNSNKFLPSEDLFKDPGPCIFTCKIREMLQGFGNQLGQVAYYLNKALEMCGSSKQMEWNMENFLIEDNYSLTSIKSFFKGLKEIKFYITEAKLFAEKIEGIVQSQSFMNFYNNISELISGSEFFEQLNSDIGRLHSEILKRYKSALHFQSISHYQTMVRSKTKLLEQQDLLTSYQNQMERLTNLVEFNENQQLELQQQYSLYSSNLNSFVSQDMMQMIELNNQIQEESTNLMQNNKSLEEQQSQLKQNQRSKKEKQNQVRNLNKCICRVQSSIQNQEVQFSSNMNSIGQVLCQIARINCQTGDEYARQQLNANLKLLRTQKQKAQKNIVQSQKQIDKSTCQIKLLQAKQNFLQSMNECAHQQQKGLKTRQDLLTQLQNSLDQNYLQIIRSQQNQIEQDTNEKRQLEDSITKLALQLPEFVHQSEQAQNLFKEEFNQQLKSIQNLQNQLRERQIQINQIEQQQGYPIQDLILFKQVFEETYLYFKNHLDLLKFNFLQSINDTVESFKIFENGDYLSQLEDQVTSNLKKINPENESQLANEMQVSSFLSICQNIMDQDHVQSYREQFTQLNQSYYYLTLGEFTTMLEQHSIDIGVNDKKLQDLLEFFNLSLHGETGTTTKALLYQEFIKMNNSDILEIQERIENILSSLKQQVLLSLPSFLSIDKVQEQNQSKI